MTGYGWQLKVKAMAPAGTDITVQPINVTADDAVEACVKAHAHFAREGYGSPRVVYLEQTDPPIEEN